MSKINIPYLDYRPDIDGLRALAVLLVVAFHAFPQQIKGGFIGVDIFFVISGFLITKIILSGLINNDSFSLAKFYSRRINRIFPALILMMIACFCFGWFALLPDEFKQLNKHIIGGASFIANLFLWRETGYFDNASATKPLLHLWSLGIEEQFYIVWPLLIWFAWKKKLNLILTILFVASLSFLLNIATVHYNVTAAFYSPQTRFWELLTGSMLALISLHKPDLLNKFIPKNKEGLISNYQSLIGFSLILIGILVIKQGRHFPGWAALLPTFGAFMIILAGQQAWFNRVVLSNRLFVWLGLISFPLYLWHWPLLSYAQIISGNIPSWQMRISAVFLAIILAWLTYQFIEKPLRSKNNRPLSVIVLLATMLIISFIAFIAYRKEGLPQRAGIEHFGKIYAQYNWNYSTNDVCLKKYPINKFGEYSWMFCIANKEKKPTLLLLGNSYANHLYPGLVANNYFKSESILSIGTCEPLWYDRAMLADSELTKNPCSGMRPLEQQQFINSIIKKTGSIRYIILSGLSLRSDEEYITSLRKRIDFFEKNNIKVIVFLPHLKLDYDVKACFPRPFKHSALSCEFSLEEYKKYLQSFQPAVDSLKTTNSKVAFFDPNRLFCDSRKCSMIDNGIPLLRDEHNHLSVYGSTKLAKIFEKWAKKNIPDLASKTDKVDAAV